MASTVFNANVVIFLGAWIIYHLPKQMSHTLAAYEITSADDCPERDPYDWYVRLSYVSYVLN